MDKRFVLNAIQLGIVGVSGLLAVLSLFIRTYIPAVIAAVLFLVFACFLPVFRDRANLWAFVFVSFVSLPVNIRFIIAMKDVDYLFDPETPFVNVIQGLLLFFVMFSVEQIVIGIVVAMIRAVRERLNA